MRGQIEKAVASNVASDVSANASIIVIANSKTRRSFQFYVDRTLAERESTEKYSSLKSARRACVLAERG